MASLSSLLWLSFGLLSTAPRFALGEVAAHPEVGDSLQQILDKAYKGPLYTYSTSLTQGIIPVSSVPLRWVNGFGVDVGREVERHPLPQ